MIAIEIQRHFRETANLPFCHWCGMNFPPQDPTNGGVAPSSHTFDIRDRVPPGILKTHTTHAGWSRTVAAEKSLREQAIGVIDEYLRAADICIKTAKPGGGILGYPAALLLLCATDAIGHGALPDNGQFTRLDVLADPLFGPALSADQARQVKNWYRHLLAHTGTMALGVHLEPDAQGLPFDFDSTGAPVLIRVGKLHEVVRSAWGRVNKVMFNPPSASKTQPAPTALPPGWDSSVSSAVSGVVSMPGYPRGRTP